MTSPAGARRRPAVGAVRAPSLEDGDRMTPSVSTPAVIGLPRRWSLRGARLGSTSFVLAALRALHVDTALRAAGRKRAGEGRKNGRGSGRRGWSGERCGVAVAGGVVGLVVDPAAVDDADPGAGEHADRVRVVVAAVAGPLVDLGGPGAGVPAVVGEGGDGGAEALVAGPPEVHGAVFAGLAGDRGE